MSIDKMRAAGRAAASVLDMIKPYVVPGVTTSELDIICYDYIVNDLKAEPECVGYNGYRHTICASPDDVVCHGIPNREPLKDGTILNIDVVVRLDGYCGDTARMYYVGKVSSEDMDLCEAAHDCMALGIMTITDGSHTGDIGYAISNCADMDGFSACVDFGGHGIGKEMHMHPFVPNRGTQGKGDVLKAGQIITVEPLVNAGGEYAVHMDDGWTVKTADGSKSAQWEHMVLVKEDGFEILTLSHR